NEYSAVKPGMFTLRSLLLIGLDFYTPTAMFVKISAPGFRTFLWVASANVVPIGHLYGDRLVTGNVKFSVTSTRVRYLTTSGLR
ncbi:MAG TPA: hypothetical protein VMI06_04980, partial [Terriglobia bacterium]|nr:hypothetical protein [Terriglobia bacterium]